MMKAYAHSKALYASMILCLLLCGCSQTYRMNRLRDLADCATLTWGLGMGASVMIGPINTGLGMQMDFVGIRDGVPVTVMNSSSVNTLFIPMTATEGGETVRFFGGSALPTRTADFVSDAIGYEQWGKYVNGASFCNRYLILARLDMEPVVDSAYHARQYYTQVEACVGLIFSGFRVGVNPGEFVDFLLGFSGIDIYGDDIYPYETRWEKLHANKENASEPVTKKL